VSDLDLTEYFRRETRNWIPSKQADDPPYITGVVVRVGEQASDYPPPAYVPTVEVFDDNDADTIWRVVGFGSVLYRELTDAKPRPGDRIGIKYVGMKSGAKGDYPAFKVLVQHSGRPEPEIDWDKLEAERPDDPGEDF
jgi:hypothetical protein